MATPKIPDLNLFKHHRYRSPTKEFIQFQDYKLSRRGYPSLCNYVPEFCPPPPPLPSYESTERPLEGAILYPAGFHEYIRAPSTYLDYAEGYLIGEPLPFVPQPTGRFQQTKHHDLSKTHSQAFHSTGTRRCDCEPGNTIKGKNPSKNVYLNPTGPSQPSKPKPPVIPKSPHRKPYLQENTFRQSNEKKKQEQPKPKPQPSKPQNSSAASNILAGFFGGKNPIPQNQSIIEESDKKRIHLGNEETVNIEIGGKRPKMISQEVQTIQNNKSQVNRSSVLIEKLMRNIPSMLDEQSFRKLLKQQLQNFQRIKLEFDDDIPIIDFEDLIQTKEQYFQFSREVQVRLNRLVGDRAEHKPSEKRNIVWPDL